MHTNVWHKLGLVTVGFISILRYRSPNQRPCDYRSTQRSYDIVHVSCVHCQPDTNPIDRNIDTIAHNRPTCSPPNNACYVSKPSFSAAENPRIWTRTNWGKVRRFGREGIRNNTINSKIRFSVSVKMKFQNVKHNRNSAEHKNMPTLKM